MGANLSEQSLAASSRSPRQDSGKTDSLGKMDLGCLGGGVREGRCFSNQFLFSGLRFALLRDFAGAFRLAASAPLLGAGCKAHYAEQVDRSLNFM
eukprot:3638329-Amphidinium_carterae.1